MTTLCVVVVVVGGVGVVLGGAGVVVAGGTGVTADAQAVISVLKSVHQQSGAWVL